MDQNKQAGNDKYGVIHEVGDMGLGFTQLSNQSDQKTLQEHERRQNEQDHQQNR